ncbi:MAG TPA: M56 family metallopeptidase [Pirellulales bacterium]|nr:M56 family metallopeptidase [Pirellulales bacterium]
MIDALNSWAVSWSDWALVSLAEGAALLAVVGVVWRWAGRRASAQFGYLLFLLVLVRLAFPATVAVPAAWGWLSPRDALGRAVAWWGDEGRVASNRRTAAPEVTDAAPPPLNADWLAANADLLPRPAGSIGAVVPPTQGPALSLSAWLMLLWATIATALFVRFVWEQWKWQRRFAAARTLDISALPLDFAELSRRLGVRRRVPIVESSAVESPAVWGLFRARLIVPPGIAARLPRKQLSWVLAHELAHVRRGDLWVVLAQRLLQIVYFFNPAVWLANRAIDRQREYACDDAAFAEAGCPGRECGSALVSVAAWVLQNSPQPALSLFSSPSLLKRRVTRLLAAQTGAPWRLSPAAFCALVVASVLVLPHLRAAEPAAAKQSNDIAAATQKEPPGPRAPSDKSREAAPTQEQSEDKGAESAASLEQRAAAIKAIRKAGGNIYPDTERLEADGVNLTDAILSDPRQAFIAASVSARGKNIDDALANLVQFPELERLQLTGMTFTEAGLTHVGRLKNLWWLSLNSTSTDDRGLSRLASLEKLQALDLSRTQVTGRGMQWLTLLKNLYDLNLDETAVDDDGLRRLAGLGAVAYLRLNNTKITDQGLASVSKLPNLAGLSLRGDAITDAGLAHLSGLTKLRRLDVVGTQITDAGLRQLDPQRKLEELVLGDTRVGDASTAWIGARKDLMLLDLTQASLTDAGLAQLAGLTKLEYLTLSGTQLTDEGLKSLASFKNLKSLQLANTGITDAGLAHLKPLVQLQRLNLSGTKIDDPRLEPLTVLAALSDVNVRNTAVTAFDVFRALPQTNRNVQKILAALNDKTELECVDYPLSDVVEYLKERHAIEIVLDNKSLAEANKGADIPITLTFRDGPLDDALKLLLAKYDLAMAIRHEVLMIGAKPLPEEYISLPILPAGARLSPKLGTALGEASELHCVDKQFRDVIENLAKRHGIEVVLDEEGLAKGGYGDDLPVTRFIKGVSLKSVLELMLGEMGLACYAEGDRLVVRPIK